MTTKMLMGTTSMAQSYTMKRYMHGYIHMYVYMYVHALREALRCGEEMTSMEPSTHACGLAQWHIIHIHADIHTHTYTLYIRTHTYKHTNSCIHQVFYVDKVTCVGLPIGVIVATSQSLARKAAQLVKVT